MKILSTFLYSIALLGSSLAQQASDYFPAQTGFEWKYKVTPLDSASNPVISLAEFRIDSFASVANYNGYLANIVATKTGPLESIQELQYIDSLFYYTEGTNGFEYLSIKNVESFLITLDELGITSNFSFLDFFASLKDWYSTYRFASGINTEYTIVQKDTTININSNDISLQFNYIGKRLQDQTIQTVHGNFDCKKFLLQWKVTAFSFLDLLTLNDTIWIAPGNWIVQDILPGQYVDNLTFLSIDPFSIPGLETKLTNEIVVAVENEKSTPSTFSLNQNYPNPFNPTTTIKYSIPEMSKVSLILFNLLGQEIITLVNDEKSAGNYTVNFNAANLPSGIYFYRIQAGDFVETRKMILLK